MIKKCSQCNIDFKCEKSNRKYCSVVCSTNSQRNQKLYNCSNQKYKKLGYNMKFKITEIQNQDFSQINVLVTVMNDAEKVLVKRVFTLPFEKYSNLDNQGLIKWVTNEVNIAKESIRKENDFKDLINQVIEL